MEKVKIDLQKYIISLLCLAGVLGIWGFLNYISYGNALEIGLGNFILMMIGIHTLGTKIRNMIWRD